MRCPSFHRNETLYQIHPTHSQTLNPDARLSPPLPRIYVRSGRFYVRFRGQLPIEFFLVSSSRPRIIADDHLAGMYRNSYQFVDFEDADCHDGDTGEEKGDLQGQLGETRNDTNPIWRGLRHPFQRLPGKMCGGCVLSPCFDHDLHFDQ